MSTIKHKTVDSCISPNPDPRMETGDSNPDDTEEVERDDTSAGQRPIASSPSAKSSPFKGMLLCSEINSCCLLLMICNELMDVVSRSHYSQVRDFHA